jgi:hypothetical protein
MYYVTTKGRGNVTLFLVDRRIFKDRWWVTDRDSAMAFKKYSAAQAQANKLRYKDPQVMGEHEAKEVSIENLQREILNEEHPFSSEALGQD